MRSGSGSQERPGEVSGDAKFVGSIPDVYERLMVPLVFAEPAAHLADTVAMRSPSEVLETAAGTGVVTRAINARIPTASIVATDLNDTMLMEAQARSPQLTEVRWQQADAQALSFASESFDAVVCQFGVMFFPERHAGYTEALRVLRSGGAFVFNVWDSLSANPLPEVVSRAVIEAAPDAPPDFLARTPYGYFDHDRIRGDLAGAGFDAELEVCVGTNRATAYDVAVAFCQGTPLRVELDAHPYLDAERATEVAFAALEREFGSGVIEAPARWIQVVATARR